MFLLRARRLSLSSKALHDGAEADLPWLGLTSVYLPFSNQFFSNSHRLKANPHHFVAVLPIHAPRILTHCKSLTHLDLDQPVSLSADWDGGAQLTCLCFYSQHLRRIPNPTYLSSINFSISDHTHGVEPNLRADEEALGAARDQMLSTLSKFTSLKEVVIPRAMEAEFAQVFAKLRHWPRAFVVPCSETQYSMISDPISSAKRNSKALADVLVPPTEGDSATSWSLRSIWLSGIRIEIGSVFLEEATLLHVLCASPSPRQAEISSLFKIAGGDSACDLRRPTRRSFNLTPFLVAVATDNGDLIELLLSQFNPDLSVRCFEDLVEGGLDCLELAASLQLPAAVDLLLKHRSLFFSSRYDSDGIFRLFQLSQWSKEGLRFLRAPAPVADVSLTFQSLLRFFGPKISISELRDSKYQRTLLHIARDDAVIDLLLRRGVDPRRADSFGQLPWVSVMDSVCAGTCTSAPLVAMLERVELADVCPGQTVLLIRALGLLRWYSSIGKLFVEPILELERRAWETATREDLEPHFCVKRIDQTFSQSIDIIDCVSRYFGSEPYFLEALESKQFRFTTKHKFLINSWLDAVWSVPDSWTLSDTCSRLDCARAGTVAFNSTQHFTNYSTSIASKRSIPTDLATDATLWRLFDCLRKRTIPMYDSSESRKIVLELVGAFVDHCARSHWFRPLEIVCDMMPCRESEKGWGTDSDLPELYLDHEAPGTSGVALSFPSHLSALLSVRLTKNIVSQRLLCTLYYMKFTSGYLFYIILGSNALAHLSAPSCRVSATDVSSFN